MKSTSSRLCAGALAAAVVLGSVVSADAAPLFAPRDGALSSSNIVKVQGRHGHNNSDWVVPAIIGGLVVGGIIAAAPRPAYAYPAPAYGYPAPAYAGPNPHVDWCSSHTPGYNAYDNTYQGYYARERVVCRSPYGG